VVESQERWQHGCRAGWFQGSTKGIVAPAGRLHSKMSNVSCYLGEAGSCGPKGEPYRKQTQQNEGRKEARSEAGKRRSSKGAAKAGAAHATTKGL
jgi:hypothetical protein